jgi:hypothetical protein
MNRDPKEIEQAVDSKALARQFHCSVNSIEAMARQGIIPCIFVGSQCGVRRFFPSAVRQALERLSLEQQVICQQETAARGPSRY